MKLPQAHIRQYRLTELFSNNDHLVLPKFQRDYSWGLNEINILIDDIVNAFNDKSDFIIGTTQMITFNKKDFYVIDGQQRLSTLYFLLKSFYELFPKQVSFLSKYLYIYDNRSDRLISDRIEREDIDNKCHSLTINTYFEESFKQIAINLVKVLGESKVLDSNGLIDFILDKVYFINTTFVETNFVTESDKNRMFIDVLQYFVNINTKGKPFDKYETQQVINFLKYN